MIKDRKDRNEKPGSNTGSKGDVPLTVPPSRSCETIPEEESATKSHGSVNVMGVEEGEIVKKNGATNPNTMSSCVHEPLLGSTNIGRRGGPISMGSIHTPSSGTGAGDLCLLENTQEVSKPDESSTQGESPSCGSIKGDVNGSNNTSPEFTPDGGEGVPPINLPMSSSTGPPPNGVQSLPSNAINKQPGTMEAQYMQQQSLIFVFSTNLANKSAEAVLRGHFPSIIAYHYTQPGTQKYLEKQPLKMNQFSRQNPDQWVNGLAQMKQKVGPNLMKTLNTMGLPGSNEMGLNPNSTGGMEMWTQNTTTMSSGGPTSTRRMDPQPCPVSNPQVRGGPKRIPPSGGMNSPCMSSGSPNPNTLLSGGGGGHHSPSMAQTTPSGMITDMVGSPGMNLQPSLTGVKIPDESLTPQQRQHREEQLATLCKMQQMLFPEHHPSQPEGGTICQQQEMSIHDMEPMMNMNPALRPNGGMINQKNLIMGRMSGPNPITTTSVAAQVEWQKLQHQFYEDRKKKGPSNFGMVGSSCDQSLGSPAVASVVVAGQPTGMGPRGSGCMGPRTQDPPSYYQTTRSASVPTAISSPSSPNNLTSNLSLPSPRATSALNSPADPNVPPFGSTSGRLIGSGPSPTGMHCTSLDSPSASQPVNSSNPGTPLSTHLSPSSTRKEGGQSGSDFSKLSQSLSVPLPTQQPPVDGMFCRTLQSLAQQKQQLQPNQGAKEPNLMPVPSPQQIHYLNSFESHELTIQKQPNTSLKETGVQSSPSLPPLSMDSNMPATTSDLPSSNKISGPGTPLTSNSLDVGSRFSSTSGESNRFPVPSPHTPAATQNDAKIQQQQQQHRYSEPSPQNPGLEPTNKPPTTEIVQRFLSSSPQTDGMDPPRIPNSGNGPNSTSPVVNIQTQNLMQPTNSSLTGMKVPPLDISPTGSGSFPCVRSKNVPLNPNTGEVICNGKTSHFDPITSMVQMSQQLANSVANSPTGQNPAIMSGLGIGPGGLGMMPYNPGVHHMQMNEMGRCPGLNDPQSGPPNFGGMPLQNSAPHSYSPDSSVGIMVPQCSGGVNTPPNMNHPIVNTNSSTSPKPNNMMMSMVPSRGSSPYPSSPVPQRMMGRQTGHNLYSSANVQVKPGAPNTINYLPTKPQSGRNSCPRIPPSLDFLRFANPLSNLDSKVPTHNLQYFPNNGMPNVSGMGSMNMPMNCSNRMVVGMSPQMGGMLGPSCGPVTNSLGGQIGNMNGPMMGPNGPMVGMNMPMPGYMAMGPNQGPGMVPMRGGPGMPQMRLGMMKMQQMGGGSPMYVAPPNSGQQVGDQIFGPGNNPNSQMFVPSSKSSPLSLDGPPDASQPLPPSMGQSNTFKNSPVIGPTTADPNYAQLFHNFQQQLYATNTRSQMNNSPHQSYFVSK